MTQWTSEVQSKLRKTINATNMCTDKKHVQGCAWIMARLGVMDRLQELVLRLNNHWQCSVSFFLDLIIGVDNGLEKLSRLSQLESFKVTGSVHRVGAQEITWMSRHWPRLWVIELPILDFVVQGTVYASLVYAPSQRCMSIRLQSMVAADTSHCSDWVLSVPMVRRASVQCGWFWN